MTTESVTCYRVTGHCRGTGTARRGRVRTSTCAGVSVAVSEYRFPTSVRNMAKLVMVKGAEQAWHSE